MAAPIQINLQGIYCPFDIGASPHAERAKIKYQNYLSHHRFTDLSDCINHLSACIERSEDPQKQRLNLNLCLACNAIAISIINQNFNHYQKIFISTSLLGMIAHSRLGRVLVRIMCLWANTETIWVRKAFDEGYDQQKARDAGITLFLGENPESYSVCRARWA